MWPQQQNNSTTMINEAPKQALARRAYQTMQFAALFVSAGIFFGIVGIALYIVPLTTDTNPSFAAYDILRGIVLFAGVGLGLTGVVLAIRAATWKTDNDLARFAGDALKPWFDDQYHFIRNLSKRGLGYIDAVMIGPEGILVFRILDFKGMYRYEGEHWMKSRNGEWLVLSSNPSKNVLEDMDNLDSYLANRGLPNFPIFGVVLFTQNEPHFSLQRSGMNPVPAAQLRDFKDRLQDTYFAQQRIDNTTAKRVYKLLYN